jgi:predicted small lipoprotein YifL
VRALAALLLALGLTGCGVKGDPVAPSEVEAEAR